MVKIRIDKCKKCIGDYSLYISFEYDASLVDIMRKQPTRFYDLTTKEWEIPAKKLESIKEQLKDYQIDMSNSNDNTLNFSFSGKIDNYIPNDYKFKIAPFKHQIDGINYGLKYDRFILGDEQGLGKSMQAINIAVIKKQQLQYKHCLIICGVNGLKWNWVNEIHKHSDESAYILGTRIRKDKQYIGTIQDRIDDLDTLLDHAKNPLPYDYPIDSYFLITNIETLRNDTIIEKLVTMCKKKIINMIVVDEIHRCKDTTCQQGKNLIKLEAESMIAMSGTPLMNSPMDLYAPVRWLGYEQHSLYAFKNHYCIIGGFGGHQIVGYRYLDQLKEQYQDIMLRRLKKDVLDLPEKIYTTEYVEMNPKQAKIYKEVYQSTREDIDRVSSAINPLAEMIRLRQATGYTGILSSTIKESAKFERLDELLNEIISNGEKVIIFSNWTSMVDVMLDRYKQYNPANITGNTRDKVAEEKKFMEDNTCKIIIGTTGAMGTGLTLTAATTVIFVDEPWNKATREQAEDRAHRIGTKQAVNIIFLICKDTIDERIHELIEEKGKLSDRLIDDKISVIDKLELVNFLLS